MLFYTQGKSICFLTCLHPRLTVFPLGRFEWNTEFVLGTGSCHIYHAQGSLGWWVGLFSCGLIFLDTVSGCWSSIHPWCPDKWYPVSTHAAGGRTKHVHLLPFKLIILLFSPCSSSKGFFVENKAWKQKEMALNVWTLMLCARTVSTWGCPALGEEAFSTSWEREGLIGLDHMCTSLALLKTT